MTEQNIGLLLVAVYVIVLAILLGVIKGIFKEADEENARLAYFAERRPGSGDYIPLAILWPVCVALSPLYGLFRLARRITINIKNND